jgi:hypothetical protein
MMNKVQNRSNPECMWIRSFIVLQSNIHSLLSLPAGEDADLCSELLNESLEALQSLPEATLFDESSVSPMWLEVVERSDKFLRQVVLG